MNYTPPNGLAANFNFKLAYTPPASHAANFNFVTAGEAELSINATLGLLQSEVTLDHGVIPRLTINKVLALPTPELNISHDNYRRLALSATMPEGIKASLELVSGRAIQINATMPEGMPSVALAAASAWACAISLSASRTKGS